MKTRAEKIIFAAAIAAGILNLVLSILFILRLPEQVPIHFDIHWVCDNYGTRWIGLFTACLALLAAVCIPLTLRKHQNEHNRRPALILMLLGVGYCIAINWLLLISLGSGVQLGETYEKPVLGWALPLLFGVLFISVGNYMPTLRQNHMVGIRVTWTLEDEQCWKLTHRFAGKVWVITGFVMTALTILAMCIGLKNGIWVMILLLEAFAVAVVVPCIYAWKHRRNSQ